MTVATQFRALGEQHGQACFLDHGTSLTINNKADVPYLLILGRDDVVITNKGTFNLAGYGAWPEDLQHNNNSNQFINEGTLLITGPTLAPFGFTSLYADLVNTGIVTISVSLVTNGGVSNSGNGDIKVNHTGRFAAKGYKGDGASHLVIHDTVMDVSTGNVILTNGSMSVFTNLEGFGSHLVGNLYLNGRSTLSVNAIGTPFNILGSFSQQETATTKLR